MCDAILHKSIVFCGISSPRTDSPTECLRRLPPPTCRLAESGDLHCRMPDIRTDEQGIAYHIAAPLLSALATLHLCGIHHRDIKPENVFLAGSRVLLGDFGFVTVSGGESCLRLGTVPFMAPEVILNDPSDPTCFRSSLPRNERLPYDVKTDVWALGVLLYESIARRLPFPGKSEEEVLRSMLRGPPCYKDFR